MTEETKNATATEEKGVRCFVRHEDAGGQCQKPAAFLVYGIQFCEAHGEEARLGAALEEHQDALNFFERLRSPSVPKLDSLIDWALMEALHRLGDSMPDDGDYQQALVDAHGENIPDAVRARVLGWEKDEDPYEHTVADYPLDSLFTIHKLIRIAEADGEHWLVEILEIERQSQAASWAAVALHGVGGEITPGSGA